jgi:5'-deoxynucleotidase YfbR-like HD superfamily hydrolase
VKHTLDFILAGSEVKRYHTVTTLVSETVGHHSHGVAMLCLMFDPMASRQLLMAALFHDLAEHQTGDIPSPAKREFGIGGKVDELELRLMTAAGIVMPHLSPEDKRTLKLADVAQGALFCAREISLGNKRMRRVFDRYISYAEELILVGREREIFNIIKDYAA